VYFSCEQKQTFLVHAGTECFMLVRNFSPSLTNVQSSSFKLGGPPPVAGQFNDCLLGCDMLTNKFRTNQNKSK